MLLSRKKYQIVMILCIILIFTGIIGVNVEYNRINGNAYDEAVYSNIFDDGRTRSDAYGEIVLNREKGTKLRMYYTTSPFDLRFSIGSKIFYINGSIFKGKRKE